MFKDDGFNTQLEYIEHLEAELAEAKEQLKLLDVDKVEAWRGEMTTTIDSLKSELFWQASTLNETSLKCLDLYKQKKKDEAERDRLQERAEGLSRQVILHDAENGRMREYVVNLENYVLAHSEQKNLTEKWIKEHRPNMEGKP